MTWDSQPYGLSLRTNDMKVVHTMDMITNHYQVDPRFGTLDEFKTLIKEADKRDIFSNYDHKSNHLILF